jgi:NAD(P)-dependent dehydrogenase (short-subunit alcohol dehydrogenase family)
MNQIILITGASSGFGRLTANALGAAGHTVYASMRGTSGKNAATAADIAIYAARNAFDVRPIELDVSSEQSANDAVSEIVSEHGHIDVIMHNAGHMVYGPSEAFTPEQLAQQYDINVISSQRVNRAVLPHMRRAGKGLVIWNSSSSVAGGTPPYLGPYFAAKAGMDALAIIYSRELALWGIETSIIVPGAFTKGTNHFANAGKPADESRAAEYESGPYAGFAERVQSAFADIVPDDADPAAVAAAVVDIVNAPFGKRPFRVVVDPSNDGAEVGFAVTDRLRREMLYRTGLSELLNPAGA